MKIQSMIVRSSSRKGISRYLRETFVDRIRLSRFLPSVEHLIDVVEALHEKVACDALRIAESHLNRGVAEVDTFEQIPKLCGAIVTEFSANEEKRACTENDRTYM